MKSKKASSNSARWDTTRWVLLGAALMVLILLSSTLSDSRDSVTYQRGHEALSAQDCVTAVAAFDDVLDNRRLIDVRGFAYRAAREKDQCLIYQQALDLEAAGKPGDAAATHYRLMRSYSDSPLFTLARDNLTGIINGYNLDDLTSDSFCQDFTGMISGAGVSDTATAEIYPNIVDSCAKMYENKGDYQAAIGWYDAYLDDHLSDNWTDYFRAALANAMWYDITQRGALNLPSPVWVGSGTGSTFVLDLYIASPDAARVVITGPSTNIFEVVGCPDCKVIPNTGEQSCHGSDARPVRVEMPVGTYQVLIEAGTGETARAYQAAWAMQTGKYEICMALE